MMIKFPVVLVLSVVLVSSYAQADFKSDVEAKANAAIASLDKLISLGKECVGWKGWSLGGVGPKLQKFKDTIKSNSLAIRNASSCAAMNKAATAAISPIEIISFELNTAAETKDPATYWKACNAYFAKNTFSTSNPNEPSCQSLAYGLEASSKANSTCKAVTSKPWESARYLDLVKLRGKNLGELLAVLKATNKACPAGLPAVKAGFTAKIFGAKVTPANQ